MKLFLILIFTITLPFGVVFAHCPLCTAGAGIGALLAKQIGMKPSVIGIWIGSFSVALGIWIFNILRVSTLANFVKIFLILVSFLSIVLPLKTYFYEIGSFYLYLFGDYGSLFNRTYVYDKFLASSILGGVVILTSPLISKIITKLRKGKTFAFQGIILTFLILVLFSIFFQFL